MYIVRDKNAKSILHISDADYDREPSPEEVYEEFDLKTMEMGKLEQDDIPPYFDINEQGIIVAITQEEFMHLRVKGDGISDGDGKEVMSDGDGNTNSQSKT